MIPIISYILKLLITLLTMQIAIVAPADPILDAIHSYFPESQWTAAVCIVNAEHGWGPVEIDAISPTDDWGLFQINRSHEGLIKTMGYTMDDMLKIRPNAEVAATIWRLQGWTPWTTHSQCGV